MNTYDDQLEQEIERYLITEDFAKLHRMLKTYVRGKSRKYATKCRAKGLRIYQDDFESDLWRAAVDLIHEEGYRKHRFRVVLNHRLEDRAKNCVRHFMRDKRRALTTALSIDEVIQGNAEIEQTALNRVLIEQMANDVSLTVDEQRLLSLLRVDPTASNQELAKDMGYNHREKVRRLKLSLRKKGGRYFEPGK